MNTAFEWTNLYVKIANALLSYKTRQPELLSFIYGMLAKNNDLQDKDDSEAINFKNIDPFTVMGIFNRNNTTANRTTIIKHFITFLKIDSEIPTSFDGIPVLHGIKSWFFDKTNYDRDTHIDKLWEFFETGIKLADTSNKETEKQFITLFDFIISQPCSKWITTMGLFWIRPYRYITLDANTRNYLNNDLAMGYKLAKVPSGERYLEICAEIQNKINSNETVNSFPALSQAAWEKNTPISYWIGGASYDSDDMSQKFINNSVYAIGFEHTDISNIVSNQDELKQWIEQLTDNNAKKAFRHLCQMKAGDRIAIKSAYAKGTVSMLRIKAIGTIIDSLADGYRDDDDLGHTLPVEWEAVSPNIDYEIGGYRETIHKLTKEKDIATIFMFDNDIGYVAAIIDALKLLDGKGSCCDIYYKIEEINKLSKINTAKNWRNTVRACLQRKSSDSGQFEGKEDLFWWDEKNKTWGLRNYTPPLLLLPSYMKKDFLLEVYMEDKKYDDIVAILERKKNIILQGAPGVGKSFLAKRLAYSIVGYKDTNENRDKDANKVEMVQFHQSYSYEDFIEGFRPTANGSFIIKEGVFYRFCNKAKKDKDNKYFFIIDEINRGNLSKIMGELMLLLEHDKRGEEFAMPLTYSGQRFHVPANIYIIGMMNTADRSLALIDYALRRRFSFIPIEPAFGHERFISDFKEKFAGADAIIDKMKKLNDSIKDKLGVGYQIGHSYFCSNEPFHQNDIDGILKYEIGELLREYFFDDDSECANALKTLNINE